MSTLFGFIVGYVVGARAGSENFDRLEQAVRDIRDSEEFKNFLTVLRGHAQGTLELLSERLKADGRPIFGDIETLASEARSRLGLAGD